MTNNERNRCSQAAPEATLDELIRELTEEALGMGGFVRFFGPGGDGDGAGQAKPPGRRRRGDAVTDDTGMRHYVYKQVRRGGVLQPPYLAGTSNNKQLAVEMCCWLCRDNPTCNAWVVKPGQDPMSVSSNSRGYWARHVRGKQSQR